MIIEQRIYTLHPHIFVEDFLEAYRREGFDLQRRVLGGFVGYFTPEFNELNRVVHMWAYTDLEDRRVRRAALGREPQWQAFLAKVRPMFSAMRNEILYPTDFALEASPLLQAHQPAPVA
jgi:hypothetical protein